MRLPRVLARAAAAAFAGAPLPLLAQTPAARAAAGDAPPAPVAVAETVLGLTAAASGTSRDTLGLLVVAVARDGPADRAGVTEGSRLAEVNGVSLRLTPAEARDGGAAAVQRLDRAVWAVRPGDAVVLRLAGFGSGRTVAVPTAAPAAAAPPAPNAAPAPGAPPVPNVTGAPAAPAAAADDADGGAPALAAVVEAMGELQTRLHRLARDEPAIALADTLAAVEDGLAALRRRLRVARAQAAQPQPAQPAAAPVAAAAVPAPAAAGLVAAGPAPADRPRLRVTEHPDDGGGEPASAGALPGLRVAPVGPDLARYFGEGSERGLLVVQADATWDPIRAGDVIVRVDGAPADAGRLRAALTGRGRSSVEFLRRGRALTLTLSDIGAR